MAEYLSKEEIKQWRSSLEKITLEEFAARLGKIVANSRPTNDLVDMVMNGDSVSSNIESKRSENLSNIAERAFARERQLSHTPFSFKAPVESVKNDKLEEKKPVETASILETIEVTSKKDEYIKVETNIVLKKNLTDREQLVFDYLLEHKNTTVYAKDLAKLLDLPRDYVYKYIKNLRAKIDGDKLKNAERGGFILTD